MRMILVLWAAAFSHFQQGLLLERTGHYAEAAQEFEAALSEASGDDLALTWNNLGAVNRQLGRYGEAERCYRQAVRVFESQLPRSARGLAITWNNLGALDLMRNQPASGEGFYRRASALDPQNAETIHGLAQCAHLRGRYQEAERLYRKVAEQALTADIAHNLATLYRETHRDASARPLLEWAVEAYERSAPTHPKLAVALRNLAELEAASGNALRAESLFRRSVEISEAALPAGHPQTAVILQAYARFLQKSNRKTEARAILARPQTVDASALIAR